MTQPESNEPRRVQLGYAPPDPTRGRLAFWGGLASLALSALCLAARLAREAGWLDAIPPLRRLAGDPATSASLGFALLAGVLASVVRVQTDRADPDAARRGRTRFALLLASAAALATLSGFILL